MRTANSGKAWSALVYALLLPNVVACGGDETDDRAAVEQAAVDTYADIVLQNYQDTVAAAKTLNTSLKALVATPSEGTIAAARQAWLDAREPYLQTEVYRFYDGPIDNPEDGPEGMINAWPLDEVYIDYVVGDDSAGIVQDESVTIDADTLMDLNESGGEKNIATGYHAIEFLLWGQDLDIAGPGARPYTDYDSSSNAEHAEYADRRGQYLSVVGDLLVEQLDDVASEWKDKADRYRQDFVANRSESLRKITTGMFQLAGKETGGERIGAALDTGQQEDEHSCFSDNTHRDMIQDVQGMLNVWRGSYKALSGGKITGTGLYQVASAYDAVLADKIDDQLNKCLSFAKDLQPPFDREIAKDNPEGVARVNALARSLNATADSLEQLLLAFGFEAPPEE